MRRRVAAKRLADSPADILIYLPIYVGSPARMLRSVTLHAAVSPGCEPAARGNGAGGSW